MEFQQEELNEILNIFQQESSEIIASMDSKLLLLERGNNPDLAIQLFRDAHSLKGSARMLGFNHIQNIAHKIEDIISLIKENKIKITSDITEVISECLGFIMMLINNTVSQKEEYISPEENSYLQKLENATKKALDDFKREGKPEYSEEEKKFLSKFYQVEKIIIKILYVISKARLNKKYDEIFKIEKLTNYFCELISNINDNEISNFLNLAQDIKNSIVKFKNSKDKELDFLDLNKSITSFIASISDYANKKNIKKIDYYEEVENKIKEEQKAPLKENKIQKAVLVENEAFGEIMEKLPLLEINCDFYNEVSEFINKLLQEETNKQKKDILLNIKKTIQAYKTKNSTLPQDVSNGLKEIIKVLKEPFEEQKIKEAFVKSDIIRTMSEFKHKEHHHTNEHIKEFSQKDILRDITNTEIKTLKVDSIKLDNLVGQIEELIVSKIKTNEQLVLAKQINNDLIEWQKNFIKMDYYIKYFDKKYLSNPLVQNGIDYRKIISYNKQLSTLAEQHSEKIAQLIKEMGNLFKQLQESEAKLNSTTNEVETMVKNMRVLPLSTIFQLFPRMVHNIAKEKNKKIDLIINGSDVTADKTIIEELKIPLMHIIRNSIDHGIEDVATRRSLGKNPIGRIEINAIYQDNKVIVDVKDNGRGLDIEKIKEKAIEKKLLTPEEISVINEEELINLIFYPGFSTEDFVTELSGRGLGLDIVNTKINQLQGRVDVYSQMNKGTVVRITLPAAIATKKVFIIQEGGQLYAIETSVIKNIARINSDDIFRKDSNNYFIYNNCAIPIYTLSQILNLESDYRGKTKFTLAIIETDNTLVGLVVEKLISDQEIVHKKLAPPLYKIKYISGVTTLASGDACLVLNIGDIINTINSKKILARISLKNNISKPQDNSKYKILIVDDSYTTRILQKNILSNRGYDVHSASEPKSALEQIKKTKFDLIITDVEMPNMNGFEFISKLRQTEDYEKAPIIVISSEPKENHLDESEKTKIAAYIEKSSFKQEELINLVEKYLN